MNSLDFPTPKDPYATMHRALGDLREAFHKQGRLDDSNAKLDEVAKLFATYLAFKKGEIDGFPEANHPKLVVELQKCFTATSMLPQYTRANGESIFGGHPALSLSSGDGVLAKKMVELIRDAVDIAFDASGGEFGFDVLNETFSHFVRDNFRGNIEDAQYMTPPEVVDFMADLVIADLEKEGVNLAKGRKYNVLDPSCGVGSFIAAFYSKIKKSGLIPLEKIALFGQDKVDRMGRLATINMELFQVGEHKISIGNSLYRGSPLDDLNDKIDLILTNPPFGARFGLDEVKMHCGDNTPFFSRLQKVSGALDSELLFIDRNLKLLRAGGRMLIVVPDGVVSARGMAAMLRSHLSHVCKVRAVVSLPATTFAQAGTRTKTAVVYLEKSKSDGSDQVLMGICSDLGFQVTSKKGVQVKTIEGSNQLPAILGAYRKNSGARGNGRVRILGSDPSVVTLPEKDVIQNTWIPNHYSAARLSIIERMRSAEALDLLPIKQVSDFMAEDRRATKCPEECAFISVLHVLGEGVIDLAASMKYRPKTPGFVVEAGEILVSRINPRIPRVCVVPDLGRPIFCSSEFEILRAKEPLDAYSLAYILQSQLVQDQICSLTSGTSASHNRIRSSEFEDVVIPVPKEGSGLSDRFASLVRAYRESLQSAASSALRIAELRGRETEIFG